MSDTDHGRTPGPPTSSRRQFLLGGAVAGIGAAAAIGAGYAISTSGDPEPEPVADVPRELNGTATIPFDGTHQAGIASAPAAHGLFVGLDLAEDVDRTRLRQMMRLLSDDASRLTQGRRSSPQPPRGSPSRSDSDQGSCGARTATHQPGFAHFQHFLSTNCATSSRTATSSSR